MLGIVVMSTSCGDFLDINKNPNAPTSSSGAKLLPSVQLAIAYGVDHSPGGLSAYASQFMQHYSIRGNNNDNQPLNNDSYVLQSWANYFTNALPDINIVIREETKNGNFQYVGVAQILKAYANTVLVDMWGSVPFTDASQGAANLYPAFEQGDHIYDEIFLLLDAGIDNIAKTDGLKPTSDDLFYGGNMDRWRKMAKTMKLRLYNQIRLTRDVSADVNALLTENDLLAAGTDDFQMRYGTSIAPDNRNPGFTSEWTEGGARQFINPYFFEIMKSMDTFGHGGLQFGVADPRIPYYFFNQMAPGAVPQNPCSYCPVRSGTQYLSIWSFSFNIDHNEGFDQSRSKTLPGLYAVGGRYDNGLGGIGANAATLAAGRVTGPGTVPQMILTYFQRKFIEAELAAEGVTAADPRALLILAMDAAFAKVNEVALIGNAPPISTGARDTYKTAVLTLYDAASVAGKLEIIMTQKWIANFNYGVDSWNDYRRTGFPRLHDGNTDALTITVRKFDPVASLPYPLGDLVTYPDLQQRNIYLDKVFWAK